MHSKLTLCFTFLLFITIPFACSGGEQKTETNQQQANTIQSAIEERKVNLNNASDLQQLVDDMGKRTFALIGEASHGTSEFYSWRAELTKKLIESGKYQFVAVEGDWAGLHSINQFVKHKDYQNRSARSLLRELDRWPLWMWANEEVLEFIEWLKDYNENKPPAERVGFYGKDVYGEWLAKSELIQLAQKHFPDAAPRIERKIECIMPYKGNISLYIRQVAQGGTSCEEPLEQMAALVQETFSGWKDEDPAAYLHVTQLAEVAKNAEAHFRKNMLGGANSWNARVQHMFATVNRLRDYYGDEASGIVWAHNTHIGDARATDMFYHGQVNIGQLSREEFGKENVYAVGFSTNRGKVMAARSWESQRLVLDVPEGIAESYEDIFNDISNRQAYYFIMEDNLSENHLWINRLGHRAIGVVYNPEQEHRGNYVPTILPNRYNALIFIPETSPVRPLH